MLNDYIKHLNLEYILEFSGYLADTDELCLRIMLLKDSEITENLINFIKEFVSVSTSITLNDKEVNYIKIFERTCSAGGSYSLLKKEGFWTINITRFRRDEELYKTESLEEVLNEIKTKYYYE